MSDSEDWVCGDCNHIWPMTRDYCRMEFDDYLGLRNLHTVDQAIEKAITPSLDKFDEAIYRVRNGIPISSTYYWRTSSGTLMTTIIAA